MPEVWRYLDVGGILVRLVGGGLEFLTDPRFNLIYISAELLQSLWLTQLRAFLNHLSLETAPPGG